jgi:hypothetical protein
MSNVTKALVLSLAAATVLWVSGGSAQQGSVGDLGLTVRQDNLDSYWLDQRNWISYGYRPYSKVHLTRFMGNLPTWSSAGGKGYSFGINESAGDAPWEGGPPTQFQMTKYGTWH